MWVRDRLNPPVVPLKVRQQAPSQGSSALERAGLRGGRAGAGLGRACALADGVGSSPLGGQQQHLCLQSGQWSGGRLRQGCAPGAEASGGAGGPVAEARAYTRSSGSRRCHSIQCCCLAPAADMQESQHSC